MKMEQTDSSKMSAYKIQMPGNYPEENIQHKEHGESLKSRKRNVFLLPQNDIFSKIRHIFPCIFKCFPPSFQESPASSLSHKCSSHFHTISPMKHIHFKITLLWLCLSRVSLPASVSTNIFHIFSLFPCFITALQIRKIFCRYLGNIVSKVWNILEYQVLCNFVVLIIGKLQITIELPEF